MWNLQPAGFQGFYGRLPQRYDCAVDCGGIFYSVTLEINCGLLFFLFHQLCLQGLNGHIYSGENGSKTLETMNQSCSLMSDSLTVTWPKKSWNRDHISYCCCNVEVPEHWDLEGGSNGYTEFGKQEVYLFPVLSPLPSHLENNK